MYKYSLYPTMICVCVCRSISNAHFVLNRNAFLQKTRKDSKPYNPQSIADVIIIKGEFSVTNILDCSHYLASFSFALFRRLHHYETEDEWGFFFFNKMEERMILWKWLSQHVKPLLNIYSQTDSFRMHTLHMEAEGLQFIPLNVSVPMRGSSCAPGLCMPNLKTFNKYLGIDCLVMGYALSPLQGNCQFVYLNNCPN